MSKTTLPYRDTGYFSKLICDFLDEDPALRSYYNQSLSLHKFKEQFDLKSAFFIAEKREVLVERLRAQYTGLELSEATDKNIESLLKENSFTVTTGHQLNLFTGPLYFLYKIISVINLAEQLNAEYPGRHVVPVYWMASEDHDFEEINYFNLHGKKISWNREDGGAVGEFSTEGLKEVAEIVGLEMGHSVHALKLQELFKKAYLEHNTLAAATRSLGHALFDEYGLVIIDGNDAELKKAFIPYAEKELFGNTAFKAVSESSNGLISMGYPEQVHPREINLFYLNDGLRERIIEQEGIYFINDTEISFTSEEIKQELTQYPERFSPNALLRPLYQEVILPNLSYTGGGGELAYWLQLKAYFEEVEVPFPMLSLRNSALLLPGKLKHKLDKLDVPIDWLFQNEFDLSSAYTRKISEIEIDFTRQREHLKQQFKDLYDIAEKTDASFKGAVGAQEKKQLNGLDRLEKRLLKAQKRNLADQLSRLSDIHQQLFPAGHLQERMMNFSEFYLEFGDSLIELLKNELDPFEKEFLILTV